MNKQDLLQELFFKVRNGEITKDEVLGGLGIAPAPQPDSAPESGEIEKKTSHFSVTKMLYFLGTAIVIIGISFFVGQIWDDIGSFVRITITLGLGLLLTAIGSVLYIQKPKEIIGQIFHVIGGVLVPGGAMVALYESNIPSTSLWPVIITFGAITVFYVLLLIFHKHVFLTFFALANGTFFIYLLFTELIIARADVPFGIEDDLYSYLTMVVGISYLLLAHSFKVGWNSRLVGALSFLGITGFLGASFSRVFDSVPWQLLFFVLILAGLFLSVYMKNRSILIMSTIFLIAHVSYITSEYFADSIGWPISLIILGFIFIGLGYASITINKKYIQ